MPSLLYLSYGTGLHELEVQYSIATAIYQANRKREKQPHFFIMTDHPQNFTACPGEVIHIPSETWSSWGGKSNFNHRRKIVALQFLMDLYPTETVLLDGDTWFRKSPSKLFKRISTQSTLLHANEGIIDNMRGSKAEALKGFLDAMNRIDDQYGENLPTRHSRMWNAGVIGLHLSHRPLLDQVLAITDFLCEHSQLHVLEQLAFSHVLPRNSHTIECLDTVFHYWPPYIHQPFRQKIETLLTETKSLSEHTRLSVLYRNRPRPTNTRRGLVLAKRLLELLRLKEKSVRSNEW